uniref:Uncharacterized protein n=1 Tax=viral metagenome TaxID=1070528 RepID=A0A6H1ZAW6_9ZZZZ
MAYTDEHINDCEFFLGKGYKEIHLYLDQYTKEFPIALYLDYHRTFLHNDYGLAIIGNVYKEEGYKAGLIHIFRDYMECPIQFLPKDIVLQRARKAVMYYNNYTGE